MIAQLVDKGPRICWGGRFLSVLSQFCPYPLGWKGDVGTWWLGILGTSFGLDERLGPKYDIAIYRQHTDSYVLILCFSLSVLQTVYTSSTECYVGPHSHKTRIFDKCVNTPFWDERCLLVMYNTAIVPRQHC